MRVVAVESDHARYVRLKAELEPFATEAPVVAYPREGTLTPPLLDQLLGHVKDDPTLYFLDPFGVDGLEAALLPRFLAAPRSEILVLFSDEGAVRLAGKAGTVVPTREDLLAERMRDPSLLGDEWDARLAATDRLAVDRMLAGHASNKRAEEILIRAFGDTAWRPIIEATPVEERRDRFVDLYDSLLQQSGATHVLRFEVTTEAGRHKYTLLHASKHVRAFAVMKEAMNRARNKRPTQAAGPTLFVSDSAESGIESTPLVDTASSREAAQLDAVSQEIARHFRGRIVRWTGKYSDDTVQAFARDYTPLLLHQFGGLQATLVRQGYQSRKRPSEYTFPDVSVPNAP